MIYFSSYFDKLVLNEQIIKIIITVKTDPIEQWKAYVLPLHRNLFKQSDVIVPFQRLYYNMWFSEK